MGINVAVVDQDGKSASAILLSVPDTCPLCTKSGHPDFVHGALNCVRPRWQLYAIFRCPVTDCRSLYVAVYLCAGTAHQVNATLEKTTLARYTQKIEFQKNLTEISPDFCDIYNQALIAEENGLSQICGPGYRKSLEFLVKDFLIKHRFKSDPTKQEEVKKSLLGPAIKNFIDQERIKQCAERATWLGNDQTHYLRKWVDKDIHDLKSLIHITAGYFDSEIEADRYLSEMPASGKS
jgi:hypothetical protein